MTHRLVIAVCISILAVGCGSDDSKDDAADTGTSATTDTGPVDPICVDAPLVTWDSWGEGFMGANCDTCHAATTLDRQGAPAEVTFDTREETLAHADRILARSTGDAPTMPPSGGISEDDRYLLEVWFNCWE